MTAVSRADMAETHGAGSTTLVWIDATEAVIVRLLDGQPSLERIESDVPAHHRATGHVRHDPGVRHGGGGVPQTAGEPRRIEHLKRYADLVADRLAQDEELLILGPGTVRERLARELGRRDVHGGTARHVACEASARLTDRQLIARLRRFVGTEPRKRTVGAYRWSVAEIRRPSGRADAGPHRVTPKPPRNRRLRAEGG